MTLEQPVHQGDDLCPTRDGTRGDWPLPETALGMERESLLPRRHTGKGKTGGDFVSNPVGLLGFEDINVFFPHVAPAWQRKAAAPASQAKPSRAPSTEGQSFCRQTPLDSGGVWQLTEVMG